MKKLVSTFALVFLFTASMAQAAHYVTGTDSVDGDEIRWGGSTAYSTAWNFGISLWNTLDPIDIEPDTIWTIEDLTVADTSQPLLGWYGAYDPGSDYIYFNSYSTRMPSLTTSQQKNIAAHELGHALGLGHHSINNNVMDDTDFHTSIGSQDEYDYDYLWN